MLLTNKKSFISWLELLIILVCAFLPLFFRLYYRINIFLSWEGAYRLYQGQVPYRDFGLPMGFGYWIIPALFFKIFGPYMSTLIKAQIFINIISGVTFRAILKLFDMDDIKRIISVMVYCFTFVLGNLWPWYNHTVIIYELIGLYLMLRFILKDRNNYSLFTLFGACFFLFLSFFTKQDAGALAILIGGALIAYTSFLEKSARPITYFILFMGIITILCVLPFIQYDFFYWFNYGQFPHNSRISLHDFISTILGESRWEKLYLLVIGLILTLEFQRNKDFYLQKKESIFALFTLGILAEALLFQVTSYVPKNNNVFFHSFCFAFIIASVNLGNLQVNKRMASVLVVLVLLWWSESYWKYLDRIIISKMFPGSKEVVEGNVGMSSFLLPTPCDTMRYSDPSTWVSSPYRAFKNVMMPAQTAAGIDYVMNMNVIKTKGPSVRMLNMSELTPLAYEIGYELEKKQPLWYHLGVGMFAKETNFFCSRIERQYYDVVLFEYIPGLNNFYPFSIRECLAKNYVHIKTFKAPRSDFQGFIEVYERRR